MKIHRGRASAGALIAEITQIAAAFGWVAIYSYFINPGQPMATYQAHAQASGPWVSILAGAPIFYAASRWIAKSRPTALALFAIFLVIDGALLVGIGKLDRRPLCPDRTQLSHQTLRLRTRRTPGMSPAFLVHIQAHLDEDLSFDVLSAKASLSPAHFQRTFQALVGETPKNYVARLRLERAAFRLSIFQWRRGGPEQQSQSHHEKILWFSHLPCPRTGPLSLTWQAARAGIYPRFLLTSHDFYPSHFRLLPPIWDERPAAKPT